MPEVPPPAVRAGVALHLSRAPLVETAGVHPRTAAADRPLPAELLHVAHRSPPSCRYAAEPDSKVGPDPPNSNTFVSRPLKSLAARFESGLLNSRATHLPRIPHLSSRRSKKARHPPVRMGTPQPREAKSRRGRLGAERAGHR